MGMDIFDQSGIDEAMIKADGTNDKSKYGANAILGISLAVAHAAAMIKGIPLYRYLNNKAQYKMPVPMMNVLNGGAHSDAPIDFQEYMIMPIGATSITEAVRMGSETFHNLKKLLKADGFNTTVGDEGGFAPNLHDNEEPLKYIV